MRYLWPQKPFGYQLPLALERTRSVPDNIRHRSEPSNTLVKSWSPLTAQRHFCTARPHKV